MNIEELTVRYYFEELLWKLNLYSHTPGAFNFHILNGIVTGAALTDEYDEAGFDEQE